MYDPSRPEDVQTFEMTDTTDDGVLVSKRISMQDGDIISVTVSVGVGGGLRAADLDKLELAKTARKLAKEAG